MADDTSAPITVDIISDVMCPWCYVGKRRFEKALKLTPDTRVDVKWRPYQLDPTIPREGVDRQEYLAKKFGGADRAKQIYQAIVDAGAQEDIPFEFDRIKRSPNTLNAHRLIRWAFTPGLQDEMVEHLFKLYFIEGADIGDHEVLLEAARHVGMDMEILSGLIASDADTDLVEKEIALAREMGVQGVPCFIVANKYAVMGAEQPEVIAHALGLAAGEQPEDEGAAGDGPAS
ncbi:MAG: DsbA family oxidoreductase [Hyphomicrobiales bacterium]